MFIRGVTNVTRFHGNGMGVLQIMSIQWEVNPQYAT